MPDDRAQQWRCTNGTCQAVAPMYVRWCPRCRAVGLYFSVRLEAWPGIEQPDFRAIEHTLVLKVLK